MMIHGRIGVLASLLVLGVASLSWAAPLERTPPGEEDAAPAVSPEEARRLQEAYDRDKAKVSPSQETPGVPWRKTLRTPDERTVRQLQQSDAVERYRNVVDAQAAEGTGVTAARPEGGQAVGKKMTKVFTKLPPEELGRLRQLINQMTTSQLNGAWLEYHPPRKMFTRKTWDPEMWEEWEASERAKAIQCDAYMDPLGILPAIEDVAAFCKENVVGDTGLVEAPAQCANVNTPSIKLTKWVRCTLQECESGAGKPNPAQSCRGAPFGPEKRKQLAAYQVRTLRQVVEGAKPGPVQGDTQAGSANDLGLENQ
jgi:hypothetical protein